MKNYIYIFILSISIISCNKNLKKELEHTYIISAERNNDTLQIDNFEILNTKKVDFDYVQNIRINNLRHIISNNQLIVENENKNIVLIKKNIANRNKLIELNKKKKDKYLLQIEYGQQELEKTELRLKNIEYQNALTHQKIVLIGFELNQNNEKIFEIVKFVFNGKINSENRIDTLELMISDEFDNKFIKNNMFINYKGD